MTWWFLSTFPPWFLSSGVFCPFLSCLFNHTFRHATPTDLPTGRTSSSYKFAVETKRNGGGKNEGIIITSSNDRQRDPSKRTSVRSKPPPPPSPSSSLEPAGPMCPSSYLACPARAWIFGRSEPENYGTWLRLERFERARAHADDQIVAFSSQTEKNLNLSQTGEDASCRS